MRLRSESQEATCTFLQASLVRTQNASDDTIIASLSSASIRTAFCPLTPSMSPSTLRKHRSLSYRIVQGPEITEEILEAASDLFSNNYGVWTDTVIPPLEPGKSDTSK